MERTESGPELGILVGTAIARVSTPWSLEASLDELDALAESAGVRVVGRASQKLARPVSATYIGSGKVEEIGNAAADLNVDVVLFDHELSPRQQRNLERAWDVKVVDRTALILDVFARHARTREGMLQVELAQYEYRLPRLTRMWTHLARQVGGRAGGASGGVGVRGPGETQLEIDRREIGRRISFLKEQIEQLRTQRRQARRHRRRSGLPQVSVVGYTNAGKSTLLNALAGSDVYTADQLFATLDPTTRRVDLPSGRTALMSDTVGFMQRLPTELVAAFRATLEEVTEADVLLHVVDVAHPDAVLQAETVERVLSELGATDVPVVVVANKVDILGDDRDREMRVWTPETATSVAATAGSDAEADAQEAGGGDVDPDTWETLSPASGMSPLESLRVLFPDLVPISALAAVGLDDLLEAVDRELQSRLVLVEALVPYDAGEVLNLLHTHGIVDDETFEQGGARIRARVPRYLLGSVAQYEVSGTESHNS
jgi:GTP-binding protein HflX